MCSSDLAAGEATVTLVNHPITGPLFSGPQQSPFLCENEAHRLAPAKDDTCSAPATVVYYYRNKTGDWKVFNPTAARPDDIGTTKTIEGKEVPMIVRQEKGVINRSAYVINMLHDPAAGPMPNPWSRGNSGWNGKLVYSFGPGVQANYHMGRGLGMLAGTENKFFLEDFNAFLDADLTRGYAMAAGSLNVFGTNSDDVKSAETMAMVKEHFIQQFGQPTYTIGHGASGGSMQQQMISNAYPGLIDAIMPARLFADSMTFLQPLFDCELLVNVFKQGTWTREQMEAVAGKYWGYCISNGARYPLGRVDNCDAAVKDFIAYDPELKAKGVRCTYQDNLVNVFGKDPKTGVARNPFDNVGVQYGLKALNDGKITFDQFVDLNTRIGGHDVNGKIVAQRQVGDELALKRAYETGRVNLGTNSSAIPYVDIRTYSDGDPINRGDPDVDVHDGYHSLVVRARLAKYASAANHVMMTTSTYGFPAFDGRRVGSPVNVVTTDAFTSIDKWMTAVANDKSDRPLAQKVAANKPAELVDSCYPAKGGILFGAFDKVTDMKKCAELFPFASDARMVAGGPATADVFKCQLRPVNAADYKTAPNAAQLEQLRKVFPDGVCDYSKPGVGFTTKVDTWAVYSGDGQYKTLR